MPGFNGTGPQGAGPMTGGGRGPCNPYGASYGRGFAGRGFVGRGPGLGMRRGFGAGGFGRGFGRGFGPSPYYPQMGYTGPYGTYSMSRDDEINWLRDEADAINAELNNISKRLQELESEA